MVETSEQDVLTGLLGARAFADRVAAAVATAAADEQPVAFVVAELPRNADDGVLIEAARRVRDVTRSRDHVARSEAQEFAICCPSATEAEGRAVARRVAETLAQPFEVSGEYLVLRVGVGLFYRDVAMGTDDAAFALVAARAAITYSR